MLTADQVEVKGATGSRSFDHPVARQPEEQGQATDANDRNQVRSPWTLRRTTAKKQYGGDDGYQR